MGVCRSARSSPHPPPAPQAGGGDLARSGTPRVHGENVAISPDQIAFYTFPELAPVEHTVVVHPQLPEADTYIEIVPAAPTEPRWYLITWQPDSTHELDRIRGGVVLDDGRQAWRVFGRSHPEVTRIVGVEQAHVVIELSARVAPPEGASLYDHVELSQPGTACVPAPNGDGFLVRCSRELDWTSPFYVRLEGLRSIYDGEAMQMFEGTFQVESADDPGMVFPSSLTPPPFPAELCASGC